MAESEEQTKPKEREIPVFTVLKNNCILKNIFLLDNPPSISSENDDHESEMEEILVVGRHPDCNIKLEHPSISRFHLRIHSKPSSRSLFVTDLSSVHGTWVSGRRIEPGVRIKVNEGDTLHLAASSRLYRLNWVPLSRAYDIDDPFVPKLDALDSVDEETEGTIDQEGDSLSYRNDLGDNVEGLERLLSDKDLGVSVQNMSPTEPPMPDDLYHPFCDKDVVENECLTETCNNENELLISQLCQLDASVTVEEETGAIEQDGDSSPCRHAQEQGLSDDMEGLELLFSDEDLVFSVQKMGATPPPIPEGLYHSILDKDEIENNCSSEIRNEENELSSSQLCQADKENSTPQAHIPSAASQIVSQAETTEYSVMNTEKTSGLSIWSRRGKPESVKIELSRSRGNCAGTNMNSQVKSVLHENCTSELMLKNQYAIPDNDDEIFTPDKENTFPNSYLVRSLKCKFEETLKSESYTPISSVDQDDKIFTPDKENVTPKSHQLRSTKNVGGFQEVKHPNSYRPSPLKTVNNSNICLEEVILPTLDKASQNQRVLRESKSTFSVSESQCNLKKQPPVLKARADREPFHPLPVNSASNHKATSIPSIHEGTMRGSRCNKYPESEEVDQSHKNTMKVSKSRWTIVADTACLLNRKSRRELQLLRGLPGTTLVIPRIVVRELDCMLKRASFLSRMTEASAALNWIEECMAATKWWIHVQSSAEEGRLVPPTPSAASPHWFSEEKSAFSVGSIPFSPYSLQEIVTPTAADHILECALLFRRTMNGQLVLLSDDVTLKIKAMAEGVLCETAEEFRRSLVNPFSPRFLYSDSSPIGPTWSCMDDTVLKEKYYPSPSKKTSNSGEGAKGLKLILLHNSNFRQMTN